MCLSVKSSRTRFLNQWLTPVNAKGLLCPRMSHDLENKARSRQRMPRQLNKLLRGKLWKRICLYFTKQIESCKLYTHL